MQITSETMAESKKTDTTMPNNVIKYKASQKLDEFIVNNCCVCADGAKIQVTNHTFHDETGTITFSRDVELIDSSAFAYIRLLTSITIPNSVTRIGGSAFEGCYGLISVTIPNSVTSIGDYAFQNCSALTSITIPEGVTTIGKRAFYFCDHLKTVNLPSSLKVIEDAAFAHCFCLTSINMPNSMVRISNGVFSRCKFRGRNIDREKLVGYKGMTIFDETMRCRGFKYEEGHKYHMDNINCCARGFHFCTDILDVFNYYYGVYGLNFVICEVEGSGKFDWPLGCSDSKVCTSDLKVLRRLPIDEVTKLINESISNADNKQI